MSTLRVSGKLAVKEIQHSPSLQGQPGEFNADVSLHRNFQLINEERMTDCRVAFPKPWLHEGMHPGNDQWPPSTAHLQTKQIAR